MVFFHKKFYFCSIIYLNTHLLARRLTLDAFLPVVRANFYYFVTSCLRDCLMLMLASGKNATINVILNIVKNLKSMQYASHDMQYEPKIERFSAKNAGNF